MGISEFSKTVLENAKYIKENLEIFDAEAIEQFLTKTGGIMESLQTVNKKDKLVVSEFVVIVICVCYIIKT